MQRCHLRRGGATSDGVDGGSNRRPPRTKSKSTHGTDHPHVEKQKTQRISAASGGRPKLIGDNCPVRNGQLEPCTQRISKPTSGWGTGYEKEPKTASIDRRGVSIPSGGFLLGPRRLDGFDGHRMTKGRVQSSVPTRPTRNHKKYRGWTAVCGARETHEHQTTCASAGRRKQEHAVWRRW